MTKTREEKIQRMLGSVNDWDLDALIESVQDTMEQQFKGQSNTEIDDEYLMFFDDDEDEVDEVDDAPTQPATTKTCTCDMTTLMRTGCKCVGA